MWATLVTILGLSAAAAAQSHIVTNGTAGETCGASRCRNKPRSATCSGDVCACQCPFSDGLGQFQCITPDEEFCTIYSDPVLLDFAGSHVHLPVSFKFLLTRVVTRPCRLLVTGTLLATGSCDVTVLGWGAQLRGKFFVQGVEVRYIIQTNTNSTIYRNFRIYGDADQGVYQFTIDGNSASDPDSENVTYGDPENIVLDEAGSTKFEIDPSNNMISLEGACGVRVSLRPVDKTQPRQLLPGVFVSVNTNCEPQFQPVDEALCAQPGNEVSRFQTLAAQLSSQIGQTVSTRVAAFLFVLRSSVVQKFPGAPSSLQTLSSVPCDDNDLIRASIFCSFITGPPKFVRCIAQGDTTGDQVTSVLSACVQAFCSRSPAACDSIKQDIASTGCEALLTPATTTILNFNCTSINP